MRLHRRNKPFFRLGNWLLLAAEGAVIGAGAALVVGAFRLIHDSAFPVLLNWFASAREHWWIPALWGLVLVGMARLLGGLVRAVPLISGSGIPQTELVVAGRLHLSRMDWLRVLAARFTGCGLSCLSGLSLGMGGPGIQLGAAVASLTGALWEHISFAGHAHIAAGAAAGMSAAFGAPLAGLVFVFEEMKTRFTWGGFALTLAAAFSAQAVVSHVFGFGRIFPFQDLREPDCFRLWTALLFGVLLGGLGYLYNRALLWLKDSEARHSPLPQRWRILPPMMLAWALAFLCPPALGGGDHLIHSLGAGAGDLALPLLLGLCLVKALFSLISTTGNAPGGVLMPILCVGAALGALAARILLDAHLTAADTAGSFVVFGMAGFFSAVLRAPLTGIALVLDMTGAAACLPGALLTGFTANLTAAALKCPPLFASLRAAIVVSRPRRAPAGNSQPDQGQSHEAVDKSSRH
ncbi:MAG: chloride channel protein [Desulfovibrionaceae bacterium]|nr:chloride channel protein [Desulfovibrionaceae bacterium]